MRSGGLDNFPFYRTGVGIDYDRWHRRHIPHHPSPFMYLPYILYTANDRKKSCRSAHSPVQNAPVFRTCSMIRLAVSSTARWETSITTQPIRSMIHSHTAAPVRSVPPSRTMRCPAGRAPSAAPCECRSVMLADRQADDLLLRNVNSSSRRFSSGTSGTFATLNLLMRQIHRQRRLRRPRYADQHDVRFQYAGSVLRCRRTSRRIRLLRPCGNSPRPADGSVPVPVRGLCGRVFISRLSSSGPSSIDRR